MIAAAWVASLWHRLCGCLPGHAPCRPFLPAPAMVPPDERMEIRVRAAIERLEPLSHAIFQAWGTAEPDAVARLFGVSEVEAERIFITALVDLDRAANEEEG